MTTAPYVSDAPSRPHRFSERFTVDGVLCDGGMGRVYAATDARTGEPLAIKTLRPDVERTVTRLSRFCREAVILSRLSHPNVVPFVDFGLDADNLPWLAMGWCEGPTLAQLLDEGPLPVDRVAYIGAQVADALAAVHDAGLVHCDVKPDNIIVDVDRGDHVTIVDFGVTQPLPSDGGRARYVSGTLGYMSPEHLSGEVLDGRADLYSLGLVLRECLTGEPAYQGTDEEIIRMQREAALPPLDVDAPPMLHALLADMIARDPGSRPPSARTVASTLRILLSGEDVADLAVPGRISGRAVHTAAMSFALRYAVGVGATLMAAASVL